MADRIVVMHDGIVEQIGTPLELFDRPGNLFVAQFIGSPSMNVFDGVVRGGMVEGLGARWPLLPGIGSDAQAVHYGIRPTDLRLAAVGIAARVVVVEPTGAETELLVEIGGRQFVVVIHGPHRRQARRHRAPEPGCRQGPCLRHRQRRPPRLRPARRRARCCNWW